MMMLYNGRPNRNKRYVPNVRYILDRIERLAISPENNESVEVDMCERCMKTKEEQIEWDKKVQGDQEIFEEMGKEDPREAYKDDLTYEGPTCPNCEVSTQIHNGVEECPVCGYKQVN
jgi:rubrerythrin